MTDTNSKSSNTIWSDGVMKPTVTVSNRSTACSISNYSCDMNALPSHRRHGGLPSFLYVRRFSIKMPIMQSHHQWLLGTKPSISSEYFDTLFWADAPFPRFATQKIKNDSLFILITKAPTRALTKAPSPALMTDPAYTFVFTATVNTQTCEWISNNNNNLTFRQNNYCAET